MELKILDELISIQKELRKKLILQDGFKKIKLVAGADLSYSRNSNEAFCAVSVFDFEAMREVSGIAKKFLIDFPYIPTFLGFREAEPIAKAVESLDIEDKPDVLLVDGHGIAHPRRFGAASHTGVLLNMPTIGVAKNLLAGEVKEGKIIYKNKTVGFALKNKKFREIYVSPGHKVSLSSSLKIVKKCMLLHRMPEPLYRAHEIASSSRVLG